MYFVFTPWQSGVPSQQWDKPLGCQLVCRFLSTCAHRTRQQHRLWLPVHRCRHAQRQGPSRARVGPPLPQQRPLCAQSWDGVAGFLLVS